MNRNADLLYRQAKQALDAGRPRQALDLLRRAKVLAPSGGPLTVAILEALLETSSLIGHVRETDIWKRQLELLRPVRTVRSPSDATKGRDWTLRFIRSKRTVILLVSCVSVFVLVWVGYSTLLSKSSHSDLAAVAQSQPSRQPVSPVEKRLAENVGLVVLYQEYLGHFNGEERSLELGMTAGTAFAVSNHGLMLTNRHVTQARIELDASMPPEFVGLKKQGEIKLLVCFGKSQDRYCRARILHESVDFDMAVIKTDQHFEDPLELCMDTVTKLQPVVACGYPGAVTLIEGASNNGHQPARIRTHAERAKSLLKSKKHIAWAEIADLAPSWYDSVVTKGIVCGPDRVVGGKSFHLFDAKVAGGNSGGPLLEEETLTVIGIVTMGGAYLPEFSGYNYALALPQLREELAGFLD